MRRIGRAPDALADVDRGRQRLALRRLRGLGPRDRALDEQRAPRRIVAQEAHRAVAIPEPERVGDVVRVVVLDGDDLEDRVGAGRRHIGVAAGGDTRADDEAPVGRHLRRDALEACGAAGQAREPVARRGHRRARRAPPALPLAGRAVCSTDRAST